MHSDARRGENVYFIFLPTKVIFWSLFYKDVCLANISEFLTPLNNYQLLKKENFAKQMKMCDFWEDSHKQS